MNKYKVIDLFAGIGGVRKGFELTGNFRCVLSAEIDTYACKTYEHLFGENPLNDVTSEDFKKKVEAINYDILLGGFPCQSFSSAGKKHGFKDKTRGTLFFDVADIIERTKPKAFLLENVQGLLTHEKGATFKIVIETLIKELNYHVVGVDLDSKGNLEYKASNFILNTKNFGLPQNRPRVYLMGFRKDLIKNIMSFPEIPRRRKKESIYSNIHEVLESKAEDRYYLSSGYLETLKKHKSRHKSSGNGFGYAIVNKEKKDTISNALLATGGSGKERNLIYQPQKGIAGKIVKNKKTPLNSEGIRVMTPTEWGRLQGFINYAFKEKNNKEGFSFPDGISVTQQYKQFGNSVSIPVIEELAQYMNKILRSL